MRGVGWFVGMTLRARGNKKGAYQSRGANDQRKDEKRRLLTPKVEDECGKRHPRIQDDEAQPIA